jgi:hypothetical protein
MNYNPLHLDPDEHVILEVRKHWIVFFGQAFGVFFAAIIPIILLAAFKFIVLSNIQDIFTGINTFLDSLPAQTYAVVLFLYTLWLLFLWLTFFVAWTVYYLDVWYVTEKRIIAVEQKRLFDREISNLRFDKIQDVTVDVHGFIPTLLNFGNIKVQTASEDNLDFIIHTVRKPDVVRQVIFSQHNEIGDVPLRNK